MAKKKSTLETKIIIVKRDAILPVNISTGFYLRCKAVAAFLIDGKSDEEIKDAYNKIKDEKIDEPWVGNLETILVLCAEFEKQANETGNIEEVTKEELEAMFTSKEETADQK